MKKIYTIIVLSLLCAAAYAQETKPTVEVHGFIRNYYAVDTREMVGLTEDFFTYVPKDVLTLNNSDDGNFYPNARFAALTSRLWVEAKGYEFNGLKVGARVEGDFYNGLGNDKVTGTANFRMRQAFVTLSRAHWNLKAGQAWHPLAADMPDVFSLNTGAPFGPFSRTPLTQFEYNFGEHLSLSTALIWQMQYASNGPSGKSAKYIEWACSPEFYFGANVKTDNLLLRAGLDVLSIKPRLYDDYGFLTDRITTLTPFFYGQYKKDLFSVKLKSVFAQAGDHLNLNGGYGVCEIKSDGNWIYTPTRNSSSWISFCYGKKLQAVLFAGYVKNFGTAKALVDADKFWFSTNSFDNLNQMVRVTPSVIYNFGKLAFGLEYEMTSVQYGDKAQGMDLSKGLYTEDLHWVTNHRVQGMIKFSF